MRIKKLIDFPEVRQALDFSCGIASAQGILYYYLEKNIRQDTLIDKVKFADVDLGVTPKDLVALFKKYGLNAKIYKNMTVADIRSHLDNNVPVMLIIQAWSQSNEKKPKKNYYKDLWKHGHYVVAIGYGETSAGKKAIIIEDPSLITNHGYLEEDELLSRWHDRSPQEGLFNKSAIVVFGGIPKFKRTILKSIL